MEMGYIKTFPWMQAERIIGTPSAYYAMGKKMMHEHKKKRAGYTVKKRGVSVKGDTHIIGGFAAGLAATQMLELDPVVVVGASVIGSLLPDICHTGSTVGRLVPYISKPVSKTFGHRKFTHSLLFLVFLSILISDKYAAFEVGFLVGVASHYILDMATRSGIQLLYPWKRKIRFPLTITTGGKMESIVKVGLTLTIVATLYHIITT